MRDTLLLILNDRFGNMMQITEANSDLILASITHPKFKLSWLNGSELDFARNLFIDKFSDESSSTENDSSRTPELESDANDFFFKFFNGS